MLLEVGSLSFAEVGVLLFVGGKDERNVRGRGEDGLGFFQSWLF